MLSKVGSEVARLPCIDEFDETAGTVKWTKRASSELERLNKDCNMTAGLETELNLAVGARVMLQRNIDTSQGLVNGALGSVTTISKDCIQISDSALGFYVYRKQFPLILAFAVTIHKCQGLSLDCAIVDLSSSVFATEMAYVAISRVRTLAGMDMEPEQEIENRSVRSGASKRKKRKDQLDEWIRLQSKLPRLLSFGLSIQNEPNHSTLLQAGTLETAAAEHQCLDVVNNAHDSVNETEPSATMLAPSNDWQPSDPCSSSQSSRPMDEYVPISMLQAPLDVCISVHSCDTSCSSSQSSQSYTLDTTATTAAINDPAKWTVTDNLREYWVLHGPTRCYNNDGRYSASKRKDAGGVSDECVQEVNRLRKLFRPDLTSIPLSKDCKAVQHKISALPLVHTTDPVVQHPKRAFVKHSAGTKKQKTVDITVVKPILMTCSQTSASNLNGMKVDSPIEESKAEKKFHSNSSVIDLTKGNDVPAVARVAPRITWPEYRYYQTDEQWQREKCRQLNLVFASPHDFVEPGGPNVVLRRPNLRTVVKGVGDGNCLVYLLGREFTVETDHRALEWLHRLKDSNPRLCRWSLTLQPFKFSVRHKAGVTNGNADALSRAGD
ncbi:hypothetical protein EMCRGX_G033634 [Ephydatia muelleri]